ncbi:MAG TPA: DUF6484 domain-containing protein [Ideonella sp.]|uniref:DUF6484 domain-containing protein n=1 Tax=Ideonella sp. TaxID=1929293 RepID=UPI002E31F491|nr:DUF6484 domain-containing protein [Ideonella sp.]HEX5686592.1 DUF6484 domain-containing protein [Ideonella sp.]
MRGDDLSEELGGVLDGADLLQPLLSARTVSPRPEPLPQVVVGELIAIVRESRTPLIRFEGQLGTAALPARSVVDLHGRHVGQPVVLMFENGRADCPIVMGLLRGGDTWPLEEAPAQVEVDLDGQRLQIGAKEQLVLRCGKASITLTKAGKVLIEGTHLVSYSSGPNRIKGGSVDLN